MTSKFSRRNFLRVAGMTAAGAGLAACAPQTVVVTQQVEKQVEVEKVITATPEPVAVAPTKRVKIYVHDLVPEDTTGPGAFGLEQQKEFAEKYPEIEVVHLPWPNVTVEKRKEYWTAALSADSGGPSAVLFDNAEIAMENASAGLLAEFDPFLPLYFKEWNDVSPFIQDLVKYQGKVYSIPGNVEGIGYVVRNDYLTEAGYDERFEPKDWTEWEAMVKKLTNDKHQGFMWNWLLGGFVDNNGGAQALEKDDKSIELHYTANENLEAVKLFHGLLHPTNYASKDPFADFGALLNDFQQGNIAVFPFFPSWLNWLFGTAKFQPEQLNFYANPLGPSALAGNTLTKPGGWVNCHAYALGTHQKPEELDAAARYICFMHSLEQMQKQATWFKDNEIKGVFASPFKSIDWSQVSYGVPEWWGPTLPTMMDRARAPLAPDYKGGTYWDKAIEQIMRDPAADIQNVLQQAEDTCKREWLDEYTKKLQES
ncbi:MAG: twin-arginine translocation signal domain-containing protein [Chloroflexi bacterium]|nr:twin-arginine translocation signal domain-containing protein [Chloroflexota bacterium]